jgi:predicted alpha/beta-hydrolase family hydrolase
MKFLENGITSTLPALVLAHGAGAPMDSPFMEYFATSMADNGLRVLRF